MKKIAVWTLAVFMLGCFAAPVVKAEKKDDLQAIKKAVKENPAYEAGKDVKWFKVLVTDAKTNKDKVRITLPIAIVEAFLRCADNKHIRMNRKDCDIDIGALFAELKKVGPMSLIEVMDEDEIVKVWLE
jgi:hypothetical protein